MWKLSPGPGSPGDVANEVWAAKTKSLVSIHYADSTRRQISMINNVLGAKQSWKRIPGGAAVALDFAEPGLKMGLEITLVNDYVELRIPKNSLKETKDNFLVDVELAPFFGAATGRDKGYLFLPDGSGAIGRFASDKQEYSRNFSEMTYGGDGYLFPSYTLRQRTEPTKVLIPVWGMVKGGDAYLAVVTKGDFDAFINVSPSGYVVDYYRGSTTFIVRKRFMSLLSVETVEKDKIETDRAVRYYFLSGSQANYVGMAQTYRHYLISEKGLTNRIPDGSHPKLYLRLFQGILQKHLVTNALVATTTFAEAVKILDSVEKAGIKDLDVELVGWSLGGWEGGYPRRFPVEPGLGGETGLKKLVAFAKQHDIAIYLQDDYLTANDRAGGFSTRQDVIRNPSGLPLSMLGQYLLNARVAWTDHASHDIPKLSRLGVSGIDFRQYGTVAISDRNRRYPMTREQFAGWYSKIADLMRSTVGTLVTQGGNSYVLARVDKLTDVPMDESDYDFATDPVPFYEIVIHGLIPYYFQPANLRNDFDTEFLRAVEYGALPLFELTYTGSSPLIKTRYNYLYSSKYTDWIDRMAYEYKVLVRDMEPVYNKKIANHEILRQGLTRTTYENGYWVIVNYNQWPERVGTRLVPARSYSMGKGGSA